MYIYRLEASSGGEVSKIFTEYLFQEEVMEGEDEQLDWYMTRHCIWDYNVTCTQVEYADIPSEDRARLREDAQNDIVDAQERLNLYDTLDKTLKV